MRNLLVLITLIASGCATTRVPPLTVDAMHVRQITAEQGLLCSYLQNVDYVAKVNTLDNNYERLHQAGENGLLNRVAGIGGNAYVSTRTDADMWWGKIDYAGEAFKCSAK